MAQDMPTNDEMETIIARQTALARRDLAVAMAVTARRQRLYPDLARIASL